MNTNEQKPVDVLAVIDAERNLVVAASAISGLNAIPAHDAMRAAVAELIEADKEYDAACEASRGSAFASSEVREAAQARWRAAKARRAAALARVGGAE